jgi:hypothetical protein
MAGHPLKRAASVVDRALGESLEGQVAPTYTDAGIKTAVTQGLDPAGSHLEAPMPQWQVTDPEWTDLLAYLKTLH